MKVGIFTYHFSDNYGALFQAYALRRWLIERGVEAEFVNYHPDYVEDGGQFDRPWILSLWRKNVTILYLNLVHIQRQLFGDREQKRAFAEFRESHLGVSQPRIHNAEQLSPLIQRYDMLICGSDQIWNPSVQRGLDPTYFLDIPGSESIHKVAYAPSFGRRKIDPIYHSELVRLLHSLDAISVRELSGVAIMEAAKCTHANAPVTPDPTILLGQFDSLLDEAEPTDNSVFCYALRTDEIIRIAAETAAKQLRSPLISPRSPHQRWRDIGHGVSPGPVEWLRMLSRARLVVSNSFHGVALSIILNRPFIAVALPGKRAEMNARVQNLLSLTGLTERSISHADSNVISQLMDAPINWEEVNARLAAMRSKAESYLDRQIAYVRKHGK